MSRANNWVRIDKNIVQGFKTINRPFSRVEALVSFSIDINCGSPWTIKGYAAMWQWSRNKVRNFVTNLQTEQGLATDGRSKYRHAIHLILSDKEAEKTAKMNKNERTPEGHPADTQGTAKGHLLTHVYEGYGMELDTTGTLYGHPEDTTRYPTNKTKTKTKTKKEKPPSATAGKPAAANADLSQGYLSKKGKSLSGLQLTSFEEFWEVFNDKRGKASAADAWLKIKGHEKETFITIMNAAKIYAATRPSLKEKGGTPKMAEGWLTDRRYEDDASPATKNTTTTTSKPLCEVCDYFIRESCKGGKPTCTAFVIHPSKG